MWNIFFFIIGMVGGYFLYLMSNYFTITKSKLSSTIKDKHLPPSSLMYKGGYINMLKCSKCDSIGDWWTLHRTSPCPECGGTVKETEPAKWCEIEGVQQWQSAPQADYEGKSKSTSIK